MESWPCSKSSNHVNLWKSVFLKISPRISSVSNIREMSRSFSTCLAHSQSRLAVSCASLRGALPTVPASRLSPHSTIPHYRYGAPVTTFGLPSRSTSCTSITLALPFTHGLTLLNRPMLVKIAIVGLGLVSWHSTFAFCYNRLLRRRAPSPVVLGLRKVLTCCWKSLCEVSSEHTQPRGEGVCVRVCAVCAVVFFETDGRRLCRGGSSVREFPYP
jgi:hypothetical protein